MKADIVPPVVSYSVQDMYSLDLGLYIGLALRFTLYPFYYNPASKEELLHRHATKKKTIMKYWPSDPPPPLPGRRRARHATFDPEIFFNIILPPIIFHAGYSLKRTFTAPHHRSQCHTHHTGTRHMNTGLAGPLPVSLVENQKLITSDYR
uniref:Uncharacterized protein n=1 Tax=Timema cristinae TaxID=61476 RepID=A0A7R9CFE1_TIMCR|nr:unnamed protein product [Timema cristinae]